MIRRCLFLLAFGSLHAGTTSLFWTNCTTDCVPSENVKAGLSDYFSICGRGSFPADLGLEYGLPCFHGIRGEVGIDYLGGRHHPLYFNGKLALDEGQLFSEAPSLSIGLFNAGTKTHGKRRTNQNIADLIFGHTLPEFIGGSLYVGLFSGSKAMGKDRQGGMAGWCRPFHRVCDAKDLPFYRWAFSADYATGKNSIGGGGLSMTYFFTPKISVQTGPTWFNSKKINGSWKWSLQIVMIF